MMKENKEKYKLIASKMREDLYRNLKLLSAAEGKSIRALLEEAVIEYLDNRRFSKKEFPGGVSETRLSVSYSIPKDKKKGKSKK